MPHPQYNRWQTPITFSSYKERKLIRRIDKKLEKIARLDYCAGEGEVLNPFDKHRFATQPVYHTKAPKIRARGQIVVAYREITGQYSIPCDRGYWTLCNKQPNVDGAEIVQLVKCGLLQKKQFYGIDYDLNDEGIIEFNQQQHPEANWFKGEWLEVIEENYELFNPGLIYFDYTRTVVTPACHLYLARTMNMCPPKTVVAANLMLSDGHSRRRFDPDLLVENLGIHLRSPSNWDVYDKYYSYKSSHTEMATYIFVRK